MSSPVFLTGAGAVSPFGGGVEALWRGALDGRTALAPIRGFATTGLTSTLAGEVPDGAVAAWLSAAECARLARVDQHALAAAREALAEARLTLAACDASRVGVVLATTLGAMEIGEDYLRARAAGTPFAARRLLDWPYAATAATLARALGVRGPVLSPSRGRATRPPAPRARGRSARRAS